MTSGLILHKSVASVLTADCQFHGPWNAEVAWGLEDDVVDQTAALKEGALAMNTAAIVLAALAYVDDATLCCAPESWFDDTELPFKVFHYCRPGGVFCSVSISQWPPCGLKPSPLEINQESPEISFSTSGLILHEPAVGVLTADCQFHGPWNAEVA